MRRSMHEFVTFAKDQNLSLSQFGALFHIQKTGGCAVSDISHDLGITSAAVSQMLERLVQHGLVARAEDPNDRRAKKIELTDLGKQTLRASMKARQRWFGELSDSMTTGERAQVIGALKILTSRTHGLEHIHEKTG